METPYVPGFLYGALTPNCDGWIDGSNFELPKEISVFASTPEPRDGSKLELGLAYFLPQGTEATFTSREFQITEPRGPAIAKGLIGQVTQRPINAFRHGHPPTIALSELPQTLVGNNLGEQTMYKVPLLFNLPLPERFDLRPPDLVIDGKAYPVRTYTYRFFKDRGAYGQCS